MGLSRTFWGADERSWTLRPSIRLLFLYELGVFMAAEWYFGPGTAAVAAQATLLGPFSARRTAHSNRVTAVLAA